MATSSARISVEIARQVKSQMTSLGFLRPERGTAQTCSGWRERLLSGYADVSILGLNRFESSFSRQQFNDCMRRDLFDGSVRAKKLEEAVRHLTNSNAVTAWTLVTSYYTAFFASIELLRNSGTFVSYFEEEAVQKICTRARAPVSYQIEEGTYHGIAHFDQADDSVKVAFAKSNIRHHKFTWTELRRIAQRAGKDLTSVDSIEGKCFEKFIGSSTPYWPSPSDIRNEWNYANAGLWGQFGERQGAEFKKIAKTRSAAVGWARRCQIRNAPELEASSIAFVMSVLLGALENVMDAALSDRDHKMILEAVNKCAVTSNIARA